MYIHCNRNVNFILMSKGKRNYDGKLLWILRDQDLYEPFLDRNYSITLLHSGKVWV